MDELISSLSVTNVNVHVFRHDGCYLGLGHITLKVDSVIFLLCAGRSTSRRHGLKQHIKTMGVIRNLWQQRHGGYA